MAKPAPPLPPSTHNRPYNGLLLTAFGLLSAAGIWFMRISPVMYGAPVGMADVLAAGSHANGVAIKTNYTGLRPLDELLSFLVTAFLPGTAGWNEAFYWQQFHFLYQISTLLAVMNIEACRERNQGSWLKYTAIYAFLYQNIGGAIIVPIWMLLLHRISGPNTYFLSGRALPIQYARLILPAILLIFLPPTIAMFVPGIPLDTLQSIVAFWQATPMLINIPLWLAASFVSTTPATEKAKTADLPSLKILYYTLFFFCTATHCFTIYKVAASETDGVTLLRVFLPSPAHWLTSMDMGLLWIFQWDWIICAALHVLPAVVAVYDVQRFLPDLDTDSDRLFKGAYIVTALVVLSGPGGALAAIWGFREEQLAVIEERAAAESGKKVL